jgi:gamma-glutamyltranspeptidase / glutathione hydrolase
MKNIISLSLFSFVLLLLMWCGAPTADTFAQRHQSGEVKISPDTWSPDELKKYSRLQLTYPSPHSSAESSHGMVVVTTDTFAGRIGLEALQRGGSAADAALATALAQVALKGGATVSYAGILMMVYYDAASKKVYSLNAGYNTLQEEKDPTSVPRDGKPSGRTALVPGFFAGVQVAHDRFGKLPFASILDPAIYLADKGFTVDLLLGAFLNSQKEVLTRLPETRRVFTKENGELYKSGDLFKQPQLAETLRKVAAQGADYIYQGEWAKRFVAAVQNEGGKMTLADLKAYRPIWSEPAQTDYHGYQVYSLGLPSLGGVAVAESLNLLEIADLKRYGHYTTSAEALYDFTQICRISHYLSRYQPGYFKTSLLGLDLSPESRIKKETSRRLWKKMHEPIWQELFPPAKPQDTEHNHSAGVVVVDARGNVAALLHSINGNFWGATGIFVDGISIPDSGVYSQSWIASLKPGARMPEGTNPLIVLKNGKPYLASSVIGDTLHSVTMNHLVNILDFGMDPTKSLSTPNFCGPLFGDDQDKIGLADGAFAKNIVDAVIAKGQAIKILPKEQPRCCYWAAIQIDPKTGNRLGATTPDLNGSATGY